MKQKPKMLKEEQEDKHVENSLPLKLRLERGIKRNYGKINRTLFLGARGGNHNFYGHMLWLYIISASVR